MRDNKVGDGNEHTLPEIPQVEQGLNSLFNFGVVRQSNAACTGDTP